MRLTTLCIQLENEIGRQLIKAPLAAAAISPFQIPPQTPESEMCEKEKNRPDHNYRENSLLFWNSDVGSLKLLNHDREDTGDGTYGLTSLFDKIRKSNPMQML